MTFVDLPARFIKYSSHPYSKGWWLRDDLLAWLTDNIGPGAQGGGWCENYSWMWVYSNDDGQPVGNKMAFIHANHAVMFKLVWGGK